MEDNTGLGLGLGGRVKGSSGTLITYPDVVDSTISSAVVVSILGFVGKVKGSSGTSSLLLRRPEAAPVGGAVPAVVGAAAANMGIAQRRSWWMSASP